MTVEELIVYGKGKTSSDHAKMLLSSYLDVNPLELLTILDKEVDSDIEKLYKSSLEALKDIANGEANKVFIPFEATSTLSSLGAIKEVMKDDKKDKKND